MAKTSKQKTEEKTAEQNVIAESIEISRKGVISGMEIVDEKDVLSSKKFVKGALQFLSPAEMFADHVRLFDGVNCKLMIDGDNAVKNANPDGTENVSYGRIKLEAVYNIDQEVSYTIGMVAALDLGAAKLKLYRGAKTIACSNMNVWASDDVVKYEIGNGINSEVLKTFINSVNLQIEKTAETVKKLKETKIEEAAIPYIIGKMVMTAKAERLPVGTTLLMNAVDIITDSESKYYYKKEGFNAWLLYNAITESFNEKLSFFDIPDKSASAFSLLSDSVKF